MRTYKNEDSELPELVRIADDDELVRASLSHFPSNRGYATEIYPGGAQLFRDCRLERGSILLHLCMPKISGHHVLTELAYRSILPRRPRKAKGMRRSRRWFPPGAAFQKPLLRPKWEFSR
jgi:CheY-like chemotaxis protein